MTKFALYDFFGKIFSKLLRAMCTFFSRKFNFFLLFSFLIIGWGEGGDARGALCNGTVNVFACDPDIEICPLDLMNTVARVRPNMGQM